MLTVWSLLSVGLLVSFILVEPLLALTFTAGLVLLWRWLRRRLAAWAGEGNP